MKNKSCNYLDLFSGIGGFHKGLEEAGFEFNWSGHSEIDRYAKSIYQGHFKESEDLGDVSNINVSKLPEIDLITFGFPCQDLSIAGKRGGLRASRSGLFYQATRIIEATKPSYFIFENVKGLFSSNGGLDWLNVLREIADIGYDGQWQLLNTRWFLPQNRERVYFVGYPRERSGQQIFPIGEGLKDAGREGKGFKDGLWSQAIDSNYYKGPDGKRTMIQEQPKIIEDFYPDRIREFDECPTLRSDRSGLKVKEDMPVANCLTADAYLTRGERKRDKNGKAVLTSMHERRIRRLTPTECERLQGFPDGWTKYGKDGEKISDTQRYKCLGNAVSVPVVKAVGERICQS